MITRTYLAKDLVDIRFYTILCNLQNHICRDINNGVLINKTPEGKKMYVKLATSKKKASKGVQEVFDYLLKFTKPDDIKFLTDRLQYLDISNVRLIEDLVSNKLLMIGSINSPSPYKYYAGAGYTYSHIKGDHNLYHSITKSPPYLYRIPKNNDIDEIYEVLPIICKRYYDKLLRNAKIADAELDKKVSDIKQFIDFLNLTPQQTIYCLGIIITDVNKL